MSKAKDAAANSLILKYLNEQNRPYSTQDVFSNLQREHGLGKTAVVKAMELLAQQGKIKEKVYGKQKIYFADQYQFPDVSDTELKSLDDQISGLTSKAQSVQQSCRQLETGLQDPGVLWTFWCHWMTEFPYRSTEGGYWSCHQLPCCFSTSQRQGSTSFNLDPWAPHQSLDFDEEELKDLNSSMTTEEMLKEIKELKQDCSRDQEKLQKIKSATNHVTPEEKEKVYNERKQYSKEWRKRKRMATDIFDAILEGYPKSKKQFFEEVGIETDEDHHVTVPDI